MIKTRFTNFFSVVACITCLLITSNANAQNWPPLQGIGGLGTSGDPWQITTITLLEELALYVNAGNGPQTAGKYYILINDISYISQHRPGWDPIGNNTNAGAIFQGNFDGNGKTVSIYSNRSSEAFIGLFGYISNAEIKNLGVEANRFIRGGQCVGGLVGRADNSIIHNCYVVGSITGNSHVGGLVGLNYNSNISNCYTLCEVSGNRAVGGFVGVNFGTVQTCYAAETITSTNGQSGGFVGVNMHTIINCYATGNVSGTGSNIGGFAGINSSGTISNCYASGDINITLGDYIGGMVGENSNSATLQNCVAANNTIIGGVSNVNRVAGANFGNESNNYAYGNMVTPQPLGGVSGIPKNMLELMSFNFYNTGSNWFNSTPWSIDYMPNPNKSWILCDDNMLPRLQWEGIICTPIIPDTCFFNAYGGDGTQGNPYKIYFPCQLADLATFVNSGNGLQTKNKYFKLMNDIDLTVYSYGNGWEPIGGYGYFDHHIHFNGFFDGNGKIITNLKINRVRLDPVGLFGVLSNATIHDLGIENCDIIGGFMASSLVGDTYNVTINR